MPEGFPVDVYTFPRTIRLVSTARLRPPVLRPLVDDDSELAALAELEGATSARLIGQDIGIGGTNPRELLFGVPHAVFINASFAYAKPREPSRFNGPARGAWYAALALETARREVLFHMRAFLAAAGDFRTTVEYVEMIASFAGRFVDLRGADPTPACLHPDPTIGYSAGNALAEATRSEGLNGIVYPSVRHTGGTCIVALWPHAVQSVVQGDVYRATWSGSPEPVFEKA